MAVRPKLAVVLLAIALTLAGCTSGSEGNASAPERTLDALLEASSRAMADVESVSFTVEQTGADIFIDSARFVLFAGAEGRYMAPRSADALIRVEALGVPTEVGAVAIDGEIWITNPLTGEWGAAPEDFAFDPSLLFDDEVGWSSLLIVGLEEPILISEGVDGDGRNQVRGTVAAERVSILTGGLVDEESEVDIWIDSVSNQVSAAAFDVGEGEELTSWRLELRDYGVNVTVTPPETVS